MLAPVRVTPPAQLPITVSEAKGRGLRVDGYDEDRHIDDLIAAATSHLDGWSGILGRCLVTQAWRVDLDGWWGCGPAGAIVLPFPDVQGASVAYFDASGAPQVVPAESHFVDARAPLPLLRFVSGWSAPSLRSGGAPPLSVTMTVGYGAPDQVPAGIKRAIHMHVQAMLDGLEDGAWRPHYDRMVGPHRVQRL